MIPCVFAIGAGKRYFLQASSPAIWKWSGLPPGLHKQFLNKGEAATSGKVGWVYDLVLGEYGSFYMAWRDKDNKNWQVHNKLPAELQAWLDLKDSNGISTRDIPNIRLALGEENESFFVTDGRSYLWKNLPAELNTAISKLRDEKGHFTDTPRLVVLGLKESYVLITSKHGASWRVEHQYPKLSAYMKKLQAENGNGGGALASVTHISLSLFDSKNFIIARNNGEYYHRLPKSFEADLKTVMESLPKATAAPAPALA